MKYKLAILCLLAIQSNTAIATELIAEGSFTKLAYRGDHIMFQISDGVTNSCAQCGPDPAAYSNSGHCWVPTTNQALVGTLLSLHAQAKPFRARVYSWTNCLVYELTVID